MDDIRAAGHAALLLLPLILLPCPAAARDTDSAEAPAPAAESTELSSAAVRVVVPYVTNRHRQAGRSAADSYTGQRGQPHFGRCEVEFRPIPVVGRVASKAPFYVPTENSQIQVAEPTDTRVFWDNLITEVERTTSRSVVLFVHGYNYGFERTCRMAAEVQRGLEGKATVLIFSWPSNGVPADYVRDQADIEWSVPFLADVLAQLDAHLGAANVQVLAHSLGTRGIVFALQRLACEDRRQALIGRLVLLAPDFDSQSFIELLPLIAPLSGSITLYASSNDTPLKASHRLSGHPRLGEAGEFLTVVENMETIDVSPAGRYEILGHEYFHFHPQVAADLATLLSTGAPAAQRPALRSRSRNELPYWEIGQVPAP